MKLEIETVSGERYRYCYLLRETVTSILSPLINVTQIAFVLWIRKDKNTPKTKKRNNSTESFRLIWNLFFASKPHTILQNLNKSITTSTFFWNANPVCWWNRVTYFIYVWLVIPKLLVNCKLVGEWGTPPHLFQLKCFCDIFWVIQTILGTPVDDTR